MTDSVSRIGVVWTESVTAASYGPDQANYRSAILEQYRAYVEMADRVSARRGSTNTFFLSLNTAILALLGSVGSAWVNFSPWVLLLSAVGLVGQCVAWYYIVRSYRQLSAAKFLVIGALEERLPCAPWQAEWSVLGYGRRRSTYWPLSRLEQWVPMLFATIYILGYAMLAPHG